MANLKGIDVSSHQKKINWKKVKESGIDFAIIRAGYGEIYEDDFWKDNVNGAYENGIGIGAYWFIYAYDKTTAINNATKFIELLSKFKGRINYPVCADFEYDTMRYMKDQGVKPTKALNTLIVNEFCKRVQSAGYYVANYVSLDIKDNYLNDTSDYDTWLATWSYNQPPFPVNLWQYSSGGKVDGISGSCDMDISFIDFPELLTERGLNFLKKPEEFEVGDLVKITKTNFSKDNYTFLLRADSYKVLAKVGSLYDIGFNGIPVARVSANCIEKQK